MERLAGSRPVLSRSAVAPVEWTLAGYPATELAIDGIVPRWRYAPASVDEAGGAVAAAVERGWSVVPRGAGTIMRLGFPPRSADLVLETYRLRRVVAYEPSDLTVTVEAGMSLGELQRLLATRSQFLPLDPPLPAEASIGGIIAANASGPLRLAYGTARDLVIGLRVVTATGQVTKAGGRVVKNVAGYDLNKLYIGSLGTLGVVVELSFKVWPLPAQQRTVAAVFAGPAAAAQAISAAIRSPLSPQCLELLDHHAAAQIGLETPSTALLLLARVAGLERAVARQAGDLESLFRQYDGQPLEPPSDEARFWDQVRHLASPVEVGDGLPIVAKASVPPAATVPVLVDLGLGARRAGLEVRAFAHAGSGIVYARLEGPRLDRATLEVAAEWLRAARAAATARQGSLVVEAAPLALKERVDVWGDAGSAFEVMAALKRALDPEGTFNPGRFVGRL